MALSSRLLLLLSLVAMTAVTGTSKVIVTRCYPPPMPHPNDRDAFHRSLLSLLDDLPSVAAPTGFASKRTSGAFARGLCFGDPAPGPCLHCLSDAGAKIANQCGNASRRAGFLNDGCFLGYADTNVSSDGIDIGGHPRHRRASANGRAPAADATATASNGDTARVLAQCATDRAPEKCDLCLSDAVLQMATSWVYKPRFGVVGLVGRDGFARNVRDAPVQPASSGASRRIVKDHIFLTVLICFIVVVAIVALVAHVCRLVMGKAGN
ncbi:hypothetical protein VPH35_022658 [Triticum aestivum]